LVGELPVTAVAAMFAGDSLLNSQVALAAAGAGLIMPTGERRAATRKGTRQRERIAALRGSGLRSEQAGNQIVRLAHVPHNTSSKKERGGNADKRPFFEREAMTGMGRRWIRRVTVHRRWRNAGGDGTP